MQKLVIFVTLHFHCYPHLRYICMRELAFRANWQSNSGWIVHDHIWCTITALSRDSWRLHLRAEWDMSRLWLAQKFGRAVKTEHHVDVSRVLWRYVVLNTYLCICRHSQHSRDRWFSMLISLESYSILNSPGSPVTVCT